MSIHVHAGPRPWRWRHCWTSRCAWWRVGRSTWHAQWCMAGCLTRRPRLAWPARRPSPPSGGGYVSGHQLEQMLALCYWEFGMNQCCFSAPCSITAGSVEAYIVATVPLSGSLCWTEATQTLCECVSVVTGCSPRTLEFIISDSIVRVVCDTLSVYFVQLTIHYGAEE